MPNELNFEKKKIGSSAKSNLRNRIWKEIWKEKKEIFEFGKIKSVVNCRTKFRKKKIGSGVESNLRNRNLKRKKEIFEFGKIEYKINCELSNELNFEKKEKIALWKVIWEIESDWNRNLKRKKKKYLNLEK